MTAIGFEPGWGPKKGIRIRLVIIIMPTSTQDNNHSRVVLAIPIHLNLLKKLFSIINFSILY